MTIVCRLLLGALLPAALGVLTEADVAFASEAPHPNVAACTPIKNAASLQAMRNNRAGVYCLMNDIDARGIPNFKPVGTLAAPFTGQLYGNGHVIRNLAINSVGDFVGLFGVMQAGRIQDLGLVDVSVTATGANSFVGALAGQTNPTSGPITISKVYVTGAVKTTGSNSVVGGMIGSFVGGAVLRDSWSSATVSGTVIAGGLAGADNSGVMERCYAIGNVSVNQPFGIAGGLVAGISPGTITESYAGGAVTGGANTILGGLAGTNNAGTITNSFAIGPVHGGNGTNAASFIGSTFNGTISSVYGAGKVSGGSNGVNLGGLLAVAAGAPTISNAYWDRGTTGQNTSAGAGAVGKTTLQLRAALPAGFNSTWGITKALSYPFINTADEFTAPLATLVSAGNIFTFLPVGQLDTAQYLHAPHHADAASLAAVYTMIARAIGITEGVGLLKNVAIDKYFWHDATQTATFTGPITAHARLTPLKTTPRFVVAQLGLHRLVILRGAYTKSGGGTATHWMLGTMYTKSNVVVSIIANDPWTGTQVEIDPYTLKVTSPANFPLTNFTLNGFQWVILN